MQQKVMPHRAESYAYKTECYLLQNLPFSIKTDHPFQFWIEIFPVTQLPGTPGSYDSFCYGGRRFVLNKGRGQVSNITFKCKNNE